MKRHCLATISLMGVFVWLALVTGCAAVGQTGVSDLAPAAATSDQTSRTVTESSEPVGSATTVPNQSNSPATASPAVKEPVPTESNSNATPLPTPTPAPTAKPTAKPTPRPTSTPKPTPTPYPPSPYYLYAEKGSYTLVAYGRDEQGQFTRVIRLMRMAIGRGSMTPSGKFTLTSRERWHTFNSIYAQYAITYKGSLYIHGPLYTYKDNHTMISHYYETIGTSDTSGCLRLTTGDVSWIYQNCPAGTTLEIVAGSPRGFTAPALQPIIVYGQDPTDPNLPPVPTSSPSATPTAEPTTEPTASDMPDPSPSAT